MFTAAVYRYELLGAICGNSIGNVSVQGGLAVFYGLSSSTVEFAARSFVAVFELCITNSSGTSFTLALDRIISNRFCDGTWMIASVISRS